MTPDESRARLIAICDERQEFVCMEDGETWWWPHDVHGAIRAWELRAIADELERRTTKQGEDME